MNTERLSKAIRDIATEVQELNDLDDQDNQTLRDASDLLLVLANIVGQMPMQRAFGRPGDWGYRTALGQALAAAPIEHIRE